MSEKVSEEEMRQALFGSSSQSGLDPSLKEPKAMAYTELHVSPKHQSFDKPLSPKLSVTLHVTKEFEGIAEVFVYDSNTLSTLVAEQNAKIEAKKRKFRYFDVVSIKSI
jgi:hypothetical protein